MFIPSCKTNKQTEGPKQRRCKVVYSYAAENSDELNLSLGEVSVCIHMYIRIYTCIYIVQWRREYVLYLCVYMYVHACNTCTNTYIRVCIVDCFQHVT